MLKSMRWSALLVMDLLWSTLWSAFWPAPALAGSLRAALHVSASACGDEAALEERVAQRLAPGVEPLAASSYRVRFETEAQALLATIEARLGGQLRWSRQLRGGSCADVADAVAVIIAVDVERQAEIAASVEGQAERAEGDAPADESKPVPERPSPPVEASLAQRDDWVFRVEAGPLFATALSNTPALGAALGAQVFPREGRWGGIGVEALALLPERVTPNVEIGLVGGRLRWLSPALPLSSVIRLRAGVGYSLALVRARGVDVERSRAANALRHALSVGGNLELSLGHWLVLVELAGEWTPARDRFVIASSAGGVLSRTELPPLPAAARIAGGYEW